MTLRRALSAVTLAAVAAATPARAQTLEPGDTGLRGSLGAAAPRSSTPAPRSAAGAADESLERLDAGTLSGGDYGGQDGQPLAGGDYGGATRPAAPAGVAAIDIGDPLARDQGLRPGSAGLRPRPRPPEDDPYAAPGVRAGSFTLRPTVEAATGYDDNPDRRNQGGKGSGYYRLRGDIEAVSEWSRHELRGSVSGQIRRYLDLEDPGYEPDLNAVLKGRIDVTERTQVISELRTSITTSRPGDADALTDVQGDQIERSHGATLGIAHRINRLSLEATGLVDRYLFDDATLVSGEPVDNAARNYTAYEARFRAAYELSPNLQPFADLSLVTRDFDRNDGVTRGSDAIALRGGATFEASRVLTGEVALGYGRQTPKDSGQKPVDALLFDGSLAWSATALTTVRLTAKSSLYETTSTDASALLTRRVGVSVEHALRRHWTVTARTDFEKRAYRGIGRVDDVTVLALETEYRLNRTTALFGSFEHDRLDSNVAGGDYTASIIEFGLRVRQ
ncbi:hypothetical protein GCM10008171_22300 [Methylopila jiangsuensis]|uniref:Outer membrane beta-barrel protein n=1 Tax=Methylopila jiangsuensis TaxID=586230 RepID=A0A9W6N470_9HYPH|nr:outer membrane beta-barrel protein [Methylopila jiangsuensis]MDR6286681.1 hypothetical protein [Methylopila jiangsuensis]GLK76976.1 hypothetical protein GCM10008171_22300 [Methylopila jiangsuensis]